MIDAPGESEQTVTLRLTRAEFEALFLPFVSSYVTVVLTYLRKLDRQMDGAAADQLDGRVEAMRRATDQMATRCVNALGPIAAAELMERVWLEATTALQYVAQPHEELARFTASIKAIVAFAATIAEP